MRTVLAAALALLAGSSSAAPGSEACRPFPPVGCLYVPASAQPSPGSTAQPGSLLVFFRGHHPDYGGHVDGDSAVLDSARAAFSGRGVGEAADVAGVAVLVTGSSDRQVTAEQLRGAEVLSGLSFGRLILAAHSGGYYGLDLTLGSDRFPADKVKRVLMLDDFYSAGPQGKIERLQRRGDVDCSGFYTYQSDSYVTTANAYSGVCALEKRHDFGGDSHDRMVNACLANYVKGTPCPPAGGDDGRAGGKPGGRTINDLLSD